MRLFEVELFKALSAFLILRYSTTYMYVWLLTKVYSTTELHFRKDIRLPLQLQKAMAAEAESTRLASAKIKVAKAEIECNRSLQVATELLMDNQWGMTVCIFQLTHIYTSRVNSFTHYLKDKMEARVIKFDVIYIF